MDIAQLGTLVGIVTGLSLLISGVVVFLVRFALVPFLERRWSSAVEEAVGYIREMRAEITVMSRAFDGHLDWSQREVDQIWAALNRRKRQ